VIFVGQENEGQLLFSFKFGLIFNSVRADSNHNYVSRLILLEVITDSLGLDCSAAGQSFGEKVKDHTFPPEIR
jgi:CO dehydrogenase/acetyl-CoA synthase gamma subunit (corrinoid Fe-S protein)